MDSGYQTIIAWILLITISSIELLLQDELCKSIRSYIASLFVILIANSILTAIALAIIFTGLIGLSAFVLIMAATGFPLIAGIRRIPYIRERNEIVESAKAALKQLAE